MATSVKDSVFKQLTWYEYGSYWEFAFESSVFGQVLSGTIEDENADPTGGPNESIYTAFLWFRDNQTLIKKILGNALYDYYQTNHESIKDGWGEEANLRAPLINCAEEIWQLLSNPAMMLSTEFADISFRFHAAWDPEHGISVWFKDKKIILVE